MTSQVLTAQAVELLAFARLMRAQTILRRELENEVLTPRGLTFNDFEALLHLGRADDNRLRRIDLAELLLLSPSGVTRLLDGLVEAGLIENVSCSDDARVTWAKLTDEGDQHARLRRRRSHQGDALALPGLTRGGRRRAAVRAARQAPRRRRRLLLGLAAPGQEPLARNWLDDVFVGDREDVVEDRQALVELLTRDRQRRDDHDHVPVRHQVEA